MIIHEILEKEINNIKKVYKDGGVEWNKDFDCIARHFFVAGYKTKEEEMIENHNRPYYIEGRGIYIPIINKVLAMKDAFDGEEVKWEDAVKAGVPTKDEWCIILYFKDEIQRLLKENGGQPLTDGYYWSSTEFSENNALYAYLHEDYIIYYYKDEKMNVRFTTAF